MPTASSRLRPSASMLPISVTFNPDMSMPYSALTIGPTFE
jgi:hypothetical protein